VWISSPSGLATAHSTLLWDFRIISRMSRLASEITWVVGIIAWFVIRYPFARRSRKTAVAQSRQNWLEWALLGAAALGLFIVPLLYVAAGWPHRFDRVDHPWLAWLGLATLLAALALFRRSHADLGRGWSASLKLRETHKLVTAGIYRQIRHPMYLSFLLLGLAQLLLLPNWFAGSVGLIAAFLMFALRVQREEAMMLDRFGAEYRDYMARSKRLIPGVY
jgi:protein-S-isoprenylcysteine O-methyltransferase Ste14